MTSTEQTTHPAEQSDVELVASDAVEETTAVGTSDAPGVEATQGDAIADDSSEDARNDGDANAGEDEEDEGASEDGEADNPLEVEAEVAADYLEELLDIADLDGDIDTYVDGDRAHVSIVSESTTLVGKDGEVLDALQELTRLAVLAETGQRSRLMLDVAGYRARRRTELVALAGDAVQEATSSAEPVHLKAMNPFERKIVHDAVAAAGLTSESEGEEPRRHVVVLPTRG
jgi:spoIIIJ-associated protein